MYIYVYIPPIHHPSARSTRIRTTVYVYQLAGSRVSPPMKLKFPSKRPRSVTRASDVSEIPKADISRPLTSIIPLSSPLSVSLSLSAFHLSRSPLRSVLSVRKGGSRETLAPYRNYRLAGINSRVYIEWRKTRREGRERAQEGWAREEMGSGSVLNLAFKFPDPPSRCLLFLFSSYSSSLFFIRQLPIPVSSATRRLALISTLAPPTLPRNGGRSFSLARETALLPRGKGEEKYQGWKHNVDRDGRNWRER